LGFFDFFRRKKENRSIDTVGFDDALLEAVIGDQTINKRIALQVPTISAGIDLISNIVSGTPIKLFRDNGGKAEEIKDDYRLRLLNDETGDTLNSNELWHAIIRDYYLGKGGYAYLNKSKNKVKSIHYVDEEKIAWRKNPDPIFKEGIYTIMGVDHMPYEFFRILRNTKDGIVGEPITKENSKLISVAYQQLSLEQSMAARGGNKKGFLKADRRIDEDSMTALKTAWANLYGNNTESMMVLNNGIDFKECSDTAAEMQLDENKKTNAIEFSKIFHISTDALSGSASDVSSLAKLAAIPLMQVIQCALNRDMLLEREKGTYYFAFDTKELLKGDIKERFEAYGNAIDHNFMQIDEVRFAEDLEPLGLSWIKLGLQDVLYDPKTKQVYTPNTNKSYTLGDSRIDMGNVSQPGGGENGADENRDP